MRLKKIRKEKGLTQQELARLTGVSRQTICNLETRKSVNNNAESLKTVSKVLNVPLAELLERYDYEGILDWEKAKRGLKYMEFAEFLNVSSSILRKSRKSGFESLSPRIQNQIANKLETTVKNLIDNDY